MCWIAGMSHSRSSVVWRMSVSRISVVIFHQFVGLPDTSATRHFGIKTLQDTSAPISRHFDTKNVVRDTSTWVPWSRKSRDTSTQDNPDETQLHRWFGLNFGTNFVVPKCLGVEVSCGRSVRLPSVVHFPFTECRHTFVRDLCSDLCSVICAGVLNECGPQSTCYPQTQHQCTTSSQRFT